MTVSVYRTSKLKVDKTSPNLKSGAPVSHWLPVKPELQLHMKLPGMFTHEPPLRQPEFTDVGAHSLTSKTHMHINVSLADYNCFVHLIVTIILHDYSCCPS